MTEKKPSDSESFVDTTKNRNSLVPLPSREVDASCVHRGITRGAGASNAFSAERGHPVFPIKLPSTTVSFSVGDLDPGASTSNHRHAYESLVYVIEGSGYTVIEGQRFDWSADDAIYIPAWCWHRHTALDGGKARYITATNMPLLNKLGLTALREEE